MIHFKKIILFIIFFILSACSSIPKNTQNSCAIFEERYLWYKHAKASYERWGAPIHLQLAFVKKESDFKADETLLDDLNTPGFIAKIHELYNVAIKGNSEKKTQFK